MALEGLSSSKSSPATTALISGAAVFALSATITRLYAGSQAKYLRVGVGLGGVTALPVFLLVRQAKNHALAKEREQALAARQARKAKDDAAAPADYWRGEDISAALAASRLGAGPYGPMHVDEGPLKQAMAGNRCEVSGDAQLIAQIKAALRPIAWEMTPTQVDQATATALRAMEIQKDFQGTHYVFFHGQSTPYLPILYAIDKLADMIYESMRAKGTHFVRFPTASTSPVQEERREYLRPDMDDYDYRRQLISVSAQVVNGDSGESALAFLGQNRNVARAATMSWTDVIEGVFEDFRQNSEVAVRQDIFREVSANLAKICALLAEHKTSGNLLVCAVPKDRIQEVGYRSHPYGIPCTCHDASQDIPILDALQQDSFSSPLHCENKTLYRGRSRYQLPSTPQFRLLTSQLTPDNGVMIKLVSPLGEPARRALKVAVGQALAPLFHTR